MLTIFRYGGQRLHALALWVAAILSGLAPPAKGDELSRVETSVDSHVELEALAARIRTKLAETSPSNRTEQVFAAELEGFDALFRRYDGHASEEALSMILFKKATLYYQVFKDHDRAISIMKELRRRFPATERAEAAIEAIEIIESDAAAAAVRKRLVPGERFPEFEASTISGATVALAEFLGSVVLVHFWSIGCDLCQSETAALRALHDRFSTRGLSIVGISLDGSRTKVQSYLKKSQIDWPVALDEQGWNGELVARYGVKSIPETYLIDGEGRIIARNLPLDALSSFLDQYLEN